MKEIVSTPRIGLYAGDPSGIGPEITARLLAMEETGHSARIRKVGDRPADVRAGEVSAQAGAHALDALREAAALLRAGEIDAFCYAPLNKQALKLAGMKHEDEMRFLIAETQFDGPAGEINIGPDFWTSRVTSHIPVKEIAAHLSQPGIAAAAGLLHRSLAASGVMRPKIAIAALNPHAGDGGNFGTEEITIIGPAVEQIRSLGIDATGPHPADTVFVAARQKKFDGVVTMYHDQGQIAMKLTGFERGVTLHGGLPWPVTTPAHGTAFDIVGEGVASPLGLLEAFRIGVRMARSLRTF